MQKNLKIGQKKLEMHILKILKKTLKILGCYSPSGDMNSDNTGSIMAFGVQIGC